MSNRYERDLGSMGEQSNALCNVYQPPVYMGFLHGERLREISGLSYSSSTQGVLWAHNDAGSDAELIALNERGAYLMSILLPYEDTDLEDVDMSRCPGRFGNPPLEDNTHIHPSCIWVGDIGDNQGKRDFVSLYIFEEPNFSLIFGDSTTLAPPDQPIKRTLTTTQVLEVRLVYPSENTPPNAETLIVDSTGERIWLIEKTDQSFTTVWYAYLDPKLIDEALSEQGLPHTHITLSLELTRLITNPKPTTEQDISGLSRSPHQITAGDLSAHGERLLLRTYFGIYEYELSSPYNLSGLGSQPKLVADYQTLSEFQGEAISYGWKDEGIWSASEAPQGDQPISWMRCSR